MRQTPPTAMLRIVLPGFALIAAAALLFQAGKIWLADYRVKSARPEDMERGAALLPGNADSWDRLGRYYLLNFSDPDLSKAVANFRKAVTVDPSSAYYWMDLANAYDASGEESAAQGAFEQAKRVYPISAMVAWNFGNFLLRQGKEEEGYAEIQRAIRTDRALLPLAISRVWRSSRDVNQLLDRVVPADADAYFATLDFFASSHEAPAGLVVWQKIVGLKAPIGMDRVFPFLEELILEDDSRDARDLWNETAEASGRPRLEVTASLVISDGAFQENFPAGGLGWRWKPELSTTIDFDAAPMGTKGRSIRVDFGGGANSDIEAPWEYVAVEPGTTYHFRARMRTEQITTDSGMRFSISDPVHSGAVDFLTDNMTGSHPWTSMEGDVTTGPSTHFLVVRLRRTPSQLFENKLSGSVWISDLSLVEVAAETSRPSR